MVVRKRLGHVQKSKLYQTLHTNRDTTSSMVLSESGRFEGKATDGKRGGVEKKDEKRKEKKNLLQGSVDLRKGHRNKGRGTGEGQETERARGGRN